MENEIKNNSEKTKTPSKKGAAFPKIAHFAKYHNGFVVGLMLAFFGGAAIFAASPEARTAVLGEEIITESGVDNSALLAASLDDFDFGMKVENVTEDDGNYYVDYSFNTYQIQDNVWKTAVRGFSMTVGKLSLAGGDLGLYVQKQLSEIVQNELAYLKEVQAAEKEKGLTRVVKATEYTGLIGLVLDAKNAILPGYDPVVKPAPVELTVASPEVPEEIADESAETGDEENNNSAPTANSNNQPSGTGGSSNNQPSSGNGTTTQEAITPASEPSESPEPSETPESPETPETSESSEPSESSETPESPEPSATEPADPEPSNPEPDPAPEPEPELEQESGTETPSE